MTNTHTEADSGHRPRILIVDDEPASVGLLLEHLGEQPFDLMVALDAADGLRKAERAPPDLVLLDLNMPHEDGFATCRRLKASPACGDVPVIFLTASTLLAHKLQGFALGCVDYITKPFERDEVLARVNLHVTMKRRFSRLKALGRQASLDAASAPPNREAQLFERATALLNSRMQDPPGLIELARSIGTNERKLTDIFRQRLGMTVFDYLTALRMDTVCHLLEHTDMQIQQIAGEVGFANPGDLTRAFRRHFQVSPTEYRQARQSR